MEEETKVEGTGLKDMLIFDEGELWIYCYKKAQDLWITKDRPAVYDGDGEDVSYDIFTYCRLFANQCVWDYRAAWGEIE